MWRQHIKRKKWTQNSNQNVEKLNYIFLYTKVWTKNLLFFWYYKKRFQSIMYQF